MLSRSWTRRFILATGSSAAAVLIGSRIYAADPVERPDLEAVFDNHGVTGTFALLDPASDHLTLVNRARAETRFIPASTFKIANSLIALETGVVEDENELISYGARKAPEQFKAWEKNMSMREAISASNILIYQEIAERIGLARYREWLDRLEYGNRKIGENVETFWLEGPLGISAVEQVKFVSRLAGQKLPMSVRSQTIVRDILKIENDKGVALYAKTGWDFSSQKQVGWWTGWIEKAEKISAFALNIDVTSPDQLAKRVPIGQMLLSRLGV